LRSDGRFYAAFAVQAGAPTILAAANETASEPAIDFSDAGQGSAVNPTLLLRFRAKGMRHSATATFGNKDGEYEIG
jgi:hypothetical protein